jgi:exonuclease SbcD
MKLLHFADLHLGIERYGQTDPATGLPTRLLDFLRALEQIVEAAIAERVDAVLFAGDAYKNRDPSPTVQRGFALRVRRLTEAGIPLVLLIGNHDLPNAWGRATSLDIFHALAVPGITVAAHIGTHRLVTRSGPLDVVALPWIARSAVLGREEYRASSMEETHQQLLETVSGWVREHADALDPRVPAVLLAHGTLSGATYGSERSALLGQDIVYHRGDLAAEAFDYIALGHIHKHQAVGQNPPAVYAGSPERVDFGEEAEEKGYVLVEIGPGERGERLVRWQFRPLPARRFRTLRLHAYGSDPRGDLIRTIERSPNLEGAIVRLVVRVASEAEGQIRPTDLRRALRAAGAAHVAGIILESEQAAARARLPVDASKTFSPLEMLTLYLDARKMEPARARRLRALAAELMPAEALGPAPETIPPASDQDV